MKLGDVFDRVEIPGRLKSIARTTLRQFAPGALEAEMRIEVDRRAERLRIWLGDGLLLDQSFDQLETYGEDPGQD
jgi:hypothetical protein